MADGHQFGVAPPQIWPPFRRQVEWDSFFEHIRRFDPWGGGVQALLAALAIVGLSIGTAPTSIAISLFIGFSLLRIHRIWRGLSSLMGMAWVPSLLAWLLWCAISLCWSSDPANGFFQHKAYVTFLLIPLGLPIIAHRVGLLWLLAGLGITHALVTDVTGVLGALGSADCAKFAYNGVFWHPTISGLWPAMAIAAGVVLWSARWRLAGAAVVIAAAAALYLHGSRSAILAGVVAGWLVAFRAARCRWRVLLVIVALAAVGTALAGSLRFGDVPRPSEVISWSQESVGAGSTVPQPQSVPDVRLAIYRAAIRGWQLAPVCGCGLGGWTAIHAEQRSRDPHLFEHYPTELTNDSAHPHSTWLEALVETGVIGAALLLAWVGLAFRALWQRAATDRLALFCLGASAVWLVLSFFNDAHGPMRMLAPLVFVLLLGAMPAAAESAARANR